MSPRYHRNGSINSAVGYLRRSTDKQEASLPDQRKAVERYAEEHGYRIIRWYMDDGILGDDTDKRTGFKQMIADAKDPGDFRVILCWDQDRFGRFDTLDAGYWIKPLRDAGVKLETVAQGRIDWDDFAGRIIYAVQQEGKHAFLRDLSRNVVRGQLEAANQGGWLGSAPYAYRLQGPRKQRRLVLDDPVKVCIVRRIFREYVEEARPMNQIAARLNADGVPSPTGKQWRFDSVRTILENPAYCGDAVGGRHSYGKYHTLGKDAGGSPKIVKGRRRCRKPEAEWIIRRNHHDAIITRETFDRAQAILARGKTGRSNRYSPEDNPYVLFGALRCGRCGCALKGVKSGKNPGMNRHYECSRREYTKHDDPPGCEGTTVSQEEILLSIADHLENWLCLYSWGDGLGLAAHYGALSPGDLPEAFATIRELVMPPTRPAVDREKLEKQLGRVKADLAKAKGNLVLLDPENIPAAQERIRQLEDERAAMERELRESKPPAEKDVNAVALEVLTNLSLLAYCCRSMAQPSYWYTNEKGVRCRGIDHGDGTVTTGSVEAAAPGQLRRLLGKIDHITVHTRKYGRASGTRHDFDRGEIVFGPLHSASLGEGGTLVTPL
jgi:DNA invertase Pin-like site-specific DNA recombinase